MGGASASEVEEVEEESDGRGRRRKTQPSSQAMPPSASASSEDEEVDGEDEQLQLLQNLYEDLDGPVAYGSASRLHQEARRIGLDVTRAQVKKVAESYTAETLFRKPRDHVYQPFIAAAPYMYWQLDLAFYPPYRRQNAILVWLNHIISTL